mmetsp:Transcript_21837/g.64428  ORF Transcript_21837/g.64428 Transcript_21837/m.64428 type:complete len:262 (-) Transcript_21837:250-1035(-)
MDDVFLVVQVGHGIEYLFDYACRLLLREALLGRLFLGDDSIEQFSPRGQFRDEVDFVLILKDVDELYNIWMGRDFQQQSDLLSQCVDLSDPGLLDSLYGVDLASLSFCALSDDAVPSGPQLLRVDVICVIHLRECILDERAAFFFFFPCGGHGLSAIAAALGGGGRDSGVVRRWDGGAVRRRSGEQQVVDSPGKISPGRLHVLDERSALLLLLLLLPAAGRRGGNGGGRRLGGGGGRRSACVVVVVVVVVVLLLLRVFPFA